MMGWSHPMVLELLHAPNPVKFFLPGGPLRVDRLELRSLPLLRLLLSHLRITPSLVCPGSTKNAQTIRTRRLPGP